MLFRSLDLPFVPLVSKLDVAGTTATLECDVKGGVEICEVSLPVVIGCAKGMAEQRIPNMRGIMAARTKPLTVVPAASVMSVAATTLFELPPAKQACKMIPSENAGLLIELLHTEAKVI